MDLDDECRTVTLIVDSLQAYYRSQQNLTVDSVNFVQGNRDPTRPLTSSALHSQTWQMT
ncbi:Hypothetical protein FKW44_002110 [Caligus rogercresseyi]|uniref:Uncharacterized protein n=1 Tax=Caligus rogercresseyi TaxID=217165 RepID=A0A7T8QW37_CALRO|nr:Hypothetical protein FKW44_002110 [Caligus rogercresseyi]